MGLFSRNYEILTIIGEKDLIICAVSTILSNNSEFYNYIWLSQFLYLKN